MIKKLILATVVAVLMIGCNNTEDTNYPTYQPVQPVQPIVVESTPEPEPATPDVGTGSVNYKPSCDGGFATITYVFRTDSTIDSNSFTIVHSVDGQRQDIITGSVFTNGSVSKMEEQVYIQPNDTDKQKVHQLRVNYISNGISQVNAFSFIQPACEVQEEESNTTMTISIPQNQI